MASVLAARGKPEKVPLDEYRALYHRLYPLTDPTFRALPERWRLRQTVERWRAEGLSQADQFLRLGWVERREDLETLPYHPDPDTGVLEGGTDPKNTLSKRLRDRLRPVRELEQRIAREGVAVDWTGPGWAGRFYAIAAPEE